MIILSIRSQDSSYSMVFRALPILPPLSASVLSKMSPLPLARRRLLRPSLAIPPTALCTHNLLPLPALQRPFSTTTPRPTTLMQVLRQPRSNIRARQGVSPALKDRPQMKGVCLKVSTMKPKKPNSAERKIAKVRLSSGRSVHCYIPGEGEWSFSVLHGRGRDCRTGERGAECSEENKGLMSGHRA